MKQFEYRCYQFTETSVEETEAALNRLGDDGWEMVILTDGGIGIFKRPKPIEIKASYEEVPA